MHRAGYCSLALLILEGAAHAQPSRAGGIAEPEPAAARRYSAPLECPNAEAFWAEVDERAPRAVPGDLRIRVRIEQKAEHYQAEMQLGGATGVTQRSVVGERCEETSAAIALVVALALAAQVEKGAPSSAPEANSQGILLSLQAEGVVDGAPAPQWVFGAGAGLRAATHDRRAELGVVLGYRGVTAEARGQSFDVAVLSLRVDACPLSLGLGERWALVPCAFVDVGAFRAEAREGFRNSAGPVFASWGSIGGSAQLRVRLAERFSAALGPGIQAPFQRGYQLATGEPSTQGSIPLYVVPTWSAFGALSALYELN
jgi:hypothetical protein